MKEKKGWRFKNNEFKYLKKVLNTDVSPKTSMTESLEKKFSKVHNQKYAIASNSGTSTLHQALYSFGVGHGDEVIIPSLTVAMCGFVVWQCGAVPVYADVDPKTFLIDPKDIEKKITKKTKAIMAVNLYGLMCDMDSILKIARKYKLYVLEDCAQCFLGKDKKNRISGTVGHAGSWSFERSKHLSTGEGGILTTNNKQLAEKMRKFGGVGFKNLTASTGKGKIDRNKFQNPAWVRHDRFSYNYRMSEITAAVGLAQVEKINYFVQLRKESGKHFKSYFNKLKSKYFKSQYIPKGYDHSYFTFPILYYGEKKNISWKEFRKKFVSFGGDGIYASWQTVNNELPFKDAMKNGLVSGSMQIAKNYGWGKTPIAEKIQKRIMQFTTNQKNTKQIETQIKILDKTIKYFNLV